MALFADTHGNVAGVREAVKRHGPFDMIVHLGDGIEDGRAAARDASLAFVGVRGNEDHTSNYEERFLLEAGSWSIMLMHGHQMDINPYQDAETLGGHYRGLASLARRSDARVICFGHTHEPLLEVVDDVIVCNPGSLYAGSAVTAFGMIEVAGKKIHISLYEKERDRDWRLCSSYNE